MLEISVKLPNTTICSDKKAIYPAISTAKNSYGIRSNSNNRGGNTLHIHHNKQIEMKSSFSLKDFFLSKVNKGITKFMHDAKRTYHES